MRPFTESPEPDPGDAPEGAEAQPGAHDERLATPPSPSALEDLSGQKLGASYVLDGLIGGGPTSQVYRGRRIDTDEIIAVRVLGARYRSDPNVVRRFGREAAATERLVHPNIARVLAHGVDAGRPYLCAQWSPGRALNQALRHGPLTLKRVLIPINDILSALAAAHREGQIHGCLKPSNVLVQETSDGGLVTTLHDFGMGRLLKPVPGTGKTKYGASCGAAEYFAPEQIDGTEIDGRADVYAVGIMLYELLTGQVPFTDPQLAEVLRRQREEVLKEVHSSERKDRKIPREVEAICLHALAKDPGDRFQSPREMARAIRALLDVLGTRADLPLEEPEAAQTRGHPLSKDRLTMPGEQLRSRQKVGVGAFLLLLVCAIVWLSAPRSDRGEATLTGTSPTTQAPGAAEALLAEGRRLLAEGDAAGAVVVLEKAQAEVGPSPVLLRWLGEALCKAGARNRGEPLLRGYLKQAPSSAPDRAEVEALLRAPSP